MTAAAPAGTAAGTLPAAKLRILCLHGYLQNADVFKARIGSLRKALKSRAEFIFMDAPYLAQADLASAQEAEENGGIAQGRSWWQWTDTEPGTRPSRAAQYTGWASSQQAIDAALEANAPIHGLLGFSQGATATALFLADRNSQLALQLQFAIVIAGFLPRDPAYAAVVQQGRPALPSLHVLGSSDALVTEDRSRGLWECFDAGSRRVFKHPGAHMVPTCSGEFKRELVALLDSISSKQRHPPAQAAAATS